MMSDSSWLSRLNADRKGIWGIVYPQGESFDVGQIADAPFGVEGVCLTLRRIEGRIELQSDQNNFSVHDFAELAKRVGDNAIGNGRTAVRIVLGEFHEAGVADQCALAKRARSIQESAVDIVFQFVFCGCWSFRAFRDSYYDFYGKTSSPPMQSKEILQVPSCGVNDVLKFLDERRLMGAYPSDFERIAAEFVVEQTSGKDWLIQKVVETLQCYGGGWTENVEQVITEVSEDSTVIEAIFKRVLGLGVGPKVELIKLLRSHRLIRRAESIDAEQLWIAGLVKRVDVGNGRLYMEIAGPVINTVVRRVLMDEYPDCVVTPEQLCLERDSILSAAYRRVAQIENMLRNLVVAHWYSSKGDKWYEGLGGIKTGARGTDKVDELEYLVTREVQVALEKRGIGESSECGPTIPEKSGKGRSQETLLDSARGWQNRQRDHHGVELAHDSLMHYLTTEGLGSVLLNKKNGLYGEGRPFQKEQLTSAFDEYVVIRAAVAHNQPIKLCTISRLDDVHRRMVEWVTVFADQSYESSTDL